MKIGRNAPCPCGSGKKYKACCLRLDRANPGLAVEAPIRETAARAEAWQADLLPFAVTFDDDPGARPAQVLVTAQGYVIHTDVLTRPSPEVDDMAAELQTALTEAVSRIGVSPPIVQVREAEVAAALTRRLRDAGSPIRVEAAPLKGLEAAMTALNQAMGGRPTAHAAVSPVTWAGWGQPDDWVADVFRLSAALYRARPWRHFDDFPPIIGQTPAGGLWYLSVLGGAGVEHGLSFFSDPGDLAGLVEDHDTMLSPSGRILSLVFEEGRRLPRPARREVARAGWEVASADAFPSLITIGTPAGGLRRQDAGDLLSVLGAVTAWTEAVDRDPELAGGPWRDPETGVVFENLAAAFVEEEPILTLEPGGPEGPGSSPEAALDQPPLGERKPRPVDGDLIERFAEQLEAEGLSEKTVSAHAGSAEIFLEYLTNWASVPIAAVHVFDLRSFLFDWYPRKVAASKSEAGRVPAALRRFFDFLHREKGISCPWAARLLKDKAAFMARWEDSPGGFWWDEDTVDWRQEHFEELNRLVLSPSPEVPGILSWGARQGMVEASLFEELQRHWLLWRDEVIRSGLRQSDEVRAVLHQREAKWLTAPRAAHGGRTPVAAIEAERAETARRMESRK